MICSHGTIFVGHKPFKQSHLASGSGIRDVAGSARINPGTPDAMYVPYTAILPEFRAAISFYRMSRLLKELMGSLGVRRLFSSAHILAAMTLRLGRA